MTSARDDQQGPLAIGVHPNPDDTTNGLSRQRGLLIRLWARVPVRFAATVLAVMVLPATIAPILPLQDPLLQDISSTVASPSSAHWLGTDEIGRDILSRIISGVRTSVSIVLFATVLCVIIGVAVGTIAGYVGGLVEAVLMRIVDVVLGFPTILVAILITAILGPSGINAGIALVVAGFPNFARVVLSETQRERELDYVKAAQMLGRGSFSIIARHILPNIFGVILVQIGIFMAFGFIVEASLSFLGLGVQVPTPSLGSMLNEGRPYFQTAWWYAVAPGAVIAVLILCVNVLSDELRDALDPRMIR